MKKIITNLLLIVLVLTMILPTAAFATNEGEGQIPDTTPTDPPAATQEPTPPPTQEPTQQPVQTPEPVELKKPNVKVSASPAELVMEGAVSLDISVQNPNSVELKNVAITVDGKTVKTVSSIAAGSTYNYSGKYTVAASKLGKKIGVTVDYDGGSVSDHFTISQKDADITVNTLVKVDKNAVEAGGEVNFSFSIENKSNVPIENASLSASTLNNGNRLGKKFSLGANGDATIILYTATITQTIDVSPVLTFEAAGKTHTKNLDTITITVNDANMEILVTPSTTTPELEAPVTFDFVIKNTGNVPFKDLALYDVNDQRITTSSNNLSAGGSITATHTMSFTESGTYDFYVYASDENGTSYSYRSLPIEIEVTEPAAKDYSDYFTLTAVVAAENSRLEKPGEVNIELTLKNTYTEPFTNVKIEEVNSGTVIETYSTFPVGEKVLPYVVEIEETTNFDFVLTATDPEGNPMTVMVSRINVPVEGEKSSSSKLSTLLIVFGIILVLIIGCGVTLVILVVKDKKQKEAAQKEAAEGHGDRRAARIARMNHAAAAAAAAPPKAAPAPAAEDPEEEDVKIYTRRPAARRSYEDLVAEPTAAPQGTPAAAPAEKTPAPAAPAPQEAPAAPAPEPAPAAPAPETVEEPILPPVRKRRHREFEDRNLF